MRRTGEARVAAPDRRLNSIEHSFCQLIGFDVPLRDVQYRQIHGAVVVPGRDNKVDLLDTPGFVIRVKVENPRFLP